MISLSHGYCTDIVSSQWLLSGHMSTHKRTVLLVPLILLSIVNVLVDTSGKIEVTKTRERPGCCHSIFAAVTTVCLWIARMCLWVASMGAVLIEGS